MERLHQDLKAMVAHCATLPPNPPADKLEQKTTEMNLTLEKDSAALPQSVKVIISSGFQSMGWDTIQKKVSNNALFNFEGLKGALQTILKGVENWSPDINIIPTPEELSSLSSACNKLWDLDVNRLVPARDYELNPQEGKTQWESGDVASDPLFVFVDEKVLEKPTFKAFIAILDNYIAQTGQSEVVTTEERQENHRFLNYAMDTAVMQYVHKYLLATGKTRSATRNQFIAELNEIWFGLYSRKTRNDSSGFEHVFLGEITEKKGSGKEVVGMHNWIQLYLEEKKKKALDYRGWIKPKRRALHQSVPGDQEQLISIQFVWRGELKPVSTTLVGTSPEFELALYTLCFYQQEQHDNDVILGPYRVRITCHTWDQHGKKYIATSYPSEIP